MRIPEPLRALLRPAVRLIRGPVSVDVDTALNRGAIEERIVDGRWVRWLVTNRGDEIQSTQLKYGFYELTELRQLASDIGQVTSVLDVGANIGNHSIYFATQMGATKLTMIEPFERAVSHLVANLALNVARLTEIHVHRMALGSAEAEVDLIPPSEFNIGLTRLDGNRKGSTRVVPGDSLRLECCDLLKIDVEGAEVDAVVGLEETIRRCRPAIYIETTERTRAEVTSFLTERGYSLLRAIEAYGTQHNLTFVARS